MEDSEQDRRITALIHTAMVASVVLYGAVVAWYRVGVVPADSPPPPPSVNSIFAVLAALALAQLSGAALAGRAILRARRGAPSGRVRFHFLLRAAAAEFVAIYAFVLGFLGAPASRVLALFAVGAAALLAWAPTKPAWDKAMAVARSGPSPGELSPR